MPIFLKAELNRECGWGFCRKSGKRKILSFANHQMEKLVYQFESIEARSFPETILEMATV